MKGLSCYAHSASAFGTGWIIPCYVLAFLEKLLSLTCGTGSGWNFGEARHFWRAFSFEEAFEKLRPSGSEST